MRHLGLSGESLTRRAVSVNVVEMVGKEGKSGCNHCLELMRQAVRIDVEKLVERIGVHDCEGRCA